MKKEKKGISLIQLLLIVILIVAFGTTVVVLTFEGLNSGGRIEENFKSNINLYQTSLDSFVSKQIVKNGGGFNRESLCATREKLEFNGSVQEGNIFDIIPVLKGSKYEKYIKINKGKIDISSFKGKKLKWATEVLGDLVYKEEKKEEIIKRDLGEGTDFKEEAMKNKIPFVPQDFNYVKGTSVENGYIIVDNFGNEYVWVPVKNKIFNDSSNYNEEKYKKLFFDYNEIINSINIYGGFYISRYEASNVNSKVASKKNQIPWINVKYADSLENLENGAYSISKNVYKDYKYNDFKSSLPYSIMWDCMLKFMQVENDNNSLDYGNYSNSSFKINNKYAKALNYNTKEFEQVYEKKVNSRLLLTTGATDRNCKKNIYDVAGNVSEWVVSPVDKNNFSYVRGGDYYDLTRNISARNLIKKNINSKNLTIGFRIALYL